ncbi:MAG: hypothetical protein AAI946_00305 [Candidatus Hodgkinia cicadicola]
MSITEPNQIVNIKLGNLVVRPAQGDKLSSKVINSALVCEYAQGWAKAVKNNNVIIGTIDLSANCVWVESVEFELSAKTDSVIIRLFADKVKTYWTNISYFTKGDQLERFAQQAQELNEVVLRRALYFGDCSVYEIEITRDELFRILSSRRFCIKLQDANTTIIEFRTCEINALLKNHNKYTPNAKIEQLDLQQNLEYNLKHKAKQYMQNPSLKGNLAEQFEQMKRRLVNEINLPRLIDANQNVPKWKNYYN